MELAQFFQAVNNFRIKLAFEGGVRVNDIYTIQPAQSFFIVAFFHIELSHRVGNICPRSLVQLSSVKEVFIGFDCLPVYTHTFQFGGKFPMDGAVALPGVGRVRHTSSCAMRRRYATAVNKTMTRTLNRMD